MMNKSIIGLFFLCFFFGNVGFAHQFSDEPSIETISDIEQNDLDRLGISVQSKKLTNSDWENHAEVILRSNASIFSKQHTALTITLVTDDDLLVVMNNFELFDQHPFEIIIPDNLRFVILVEIKEPMGGLEPGRYRFETE